MVASVSRWGPDDGTCPKCGRACGPDDRYASYRQCKDCVKAYEVQRQAALSGEARERRLAQARRSHIKGKYGLTAEAYDGLVERQGGRCAICRGEGPFHVDHDHACCSGHRTCGRCIRGLLCAHCNRMLGSAKDQPAVLLAAAEYLRNAELRSQRA